jgi:hypothetical protein
VVKREADSTSATTARMRLRRVEDPSSCARKDTNWASMTGGGTKSGAAAALGGAGEQRCRKGRRRETGRGGRRREAAAGKGGDPERAAAALRRSEAAVTMAATAAGRIAERGLGDVFYGGGVSWKTETRGAVERTSELAHHLFWAEPGRA